MLMLYQFRNLMVESNGYGSQKNIWNWQFSRPFAKVVQLLYSLIFEYTTFYI